MNKILLFLSVLVCNILYSQGIQSPKDFFGHQMGAEGQIINFFEGLKYYQSLAEKSDRIQYFELGKTTDGNPFVMMAISSPENLKKIESIKKQRKQLTDPRKISDSQAKKLADNLPAVVYHTSSIHTTEISTAQVVPELVYNLVANDDDETKRIRNNVIVLVSPTANPDGQVKIKEWYDEHKGKPWESNMPWLYHTYVGHDNNRDWVMLHFPEQRLTAQKIYMDWTPSYSLEMHQMGGNGARIFVPPYQDPHDENVSPEIVETMNLIGTTMSHRLTSEGKAGVVKNAIYDLYTPARAFQIYRGVARVLTETASANFATTRVVKKEELQTGGRAGSGIYHPLKKSWNFPLPWTGGAWSMREMLEYQLSANMAALNLVASNPSSFNYSIYNSLKSVVENSDWPFAYVIPLKQNDPSSMVRMVRALQRGGIEVHRAKTDFMADGLEYSAGSHIVRLRQPYGGWAKTLLEVQEYPDLRRTEEEEPLVPYDVTASTLPLMMGVDAKRIEGEFDVEATLLTNPISFKSTIIGKGKFYAILPFSNEAYAMADELLDKGISMKWVQQDFNEGELAISSGSFIIEQNGETESILKEYVERWNFQAISIDQVPDNHSVSLSDPRIGIFEPWGGLMDAGWTRHMLEQWKLDPKTVRIEDIKSTDLNSTYDIILFPDGLSIERIMDGRQRNPDKYKGGIGQKGKANLQKFINKGGTVASFGRTSTTLAELFDVPVENVVDGLTSSEFYAPGSLVLTELDSKSPLGYGLGDKIAVLDRQGPVFNPKASVDKTVDIVGSFPNYDGRLSGFLLGELKMRGKGSIAVMKQGKGRIILFSMTPQFRAMTHGSYKLVFNSIFWAATN